jgi:hypothetical protein
MIFAMLRFLSVRAAAPVVLLSALACSGGSTSSGGDGGTALCFVHFSGTPTGRPSPATCAATSVPVLGDAGVIACKTDGDCSNDELHHWCRNGTCVPDQCYGDSDCPKGQACACADEQIGNASHTNVCAAAGCRSDSDCAGGEVCSQTAQDYCSGGTDFFACHSSADTCRVDADCCSSAPACRYQSTLGHWACAPVCTAAG